LRRPAPTTVAYPPSLHDALPICFLQLLAQLVGLGLQVDVRQHLADRLGADAGGEGVRAEIVLRVEEFLFAQQLAVGKLGQAGLRSEEHTSELQSRENLVCRLLLE